MAKTRNWIGLLSGAGLIAISVSPFTSTSAMATPPAESTNLQVAEGQQQQQYQPPQQQQNKDQQKNQQRGQQQNQQNPQIWHGQQNWQNQQGGQQNWQSRQGGQQNWQGGQNQPNWQNQQGGQQQYQQGGQQHNQQGGQQWSQQGHRYNWSSYQPGHRPPEWERYHKDFDPHPYQGNWYAERRYDWHRYVPPHGWYYRRWVYGEVLPPIFWGRDYWLDSYWQFGLMDPPYGYVWVRYDSDALLVDVAIGQILSVMYGVFYPTVGYAPSNNYVPPNNYAPPGIYSSPPMQQPAPSPVWYYCDNPQGYYPYVQSCYSGWRQVPAIPPDATYSQPQ
jgi:hypothetical protein